MWIWDDLDKNPAIFFLHSMLHFRYSTFEALDMVPTTKESSLYKLLKCNFSHRKKSFLFALRTVTVQASYVLRICDALILQILHPLGFDHPF